MAKPKGARKEPERVTSTEAYRNFADYVRRARETDDVFIVTQHGEDAVAIVAASEYSRLREVA